MDIQTAQLEAELTADVTNEEIDLFLQSMADEEDMWLIEHYCHLVTIHGCEKIATAKTVTTLINE